MGLPGEPRAPAILFTGSGWQMDSDVLLIRNFTEIRTAHSVEQIPEVLSQIEEIVHRDSMQLVIWHMRLPQLLVYRYVQLQILSHLNHSSGSEFFEKMKWNICPSIQSSLCLISYTVHLS